MSNTECLGYLIEMMKRAGFKKEDIQKVLDESRYAFDEISESEAEEIYKKFF